MRDGGGDGTRKIVYFAGFHYFITLLSLVSYFGIFFSVLFFSTGKSPSSPRKNEDENTKLRFALKNKIQGNFFEKPKLLHTQIFGRFV